MVMTMEEIEWPNTEEDGAANSDVLETKRLG